MEEILRSEEDSMKKGFKMEWKSIKSHLPPHGDKVLVTDGCLVGVAYAEGNYFVGCDKPYMIPTWWLALPNLPDCDAKKGKGNWECTDIPKIVFDEDPREAYEKTGTMTSLRFNQKLSNPQRSHTE